MIATAVVAATLAGCGSEGPDSTEKNGEGDGAKKPFDVIASTTVTTATRVSKPEFVAQVNGICKHGWFEVLDNYAEYTSWQSPKLNDKELFTKAVRLSFLAGFDFHVFDPIILIKAPAGEKRQVEEVVGALQEGVERGQRVVRVTTVPQLNALFTKYNAAVRRYGLSPECQVHGARLLKVQA